MNRSLELKVGAFLLASFAVLVVVLVVTGPLATYRGKRVAVDFGYAGPVKPGAAVRLSGVVVGAVERVELIGGRGDDPSVMVRVHTRIHDDASALATTSARFYVTTLGVLGEHYVDLEPHAGGEVLADGSVTRGIDLARPDLLLPRAASLLELMRGLLDEGRPDAVALLKKVGDLVERTDALLTSDEGKALSTDARALFADVRSLVVALNTVVGNGDRMRALVAETERSLQSGNRLLGELEGAKLGETVVEARTTMGAARGTMGRVDSALDVAKDGLLLDNPRQRELASTFEKTFWELERVARSADKLIAALDKGEGAMGEAFQDKELVQDLKAVLKQVRKNPAGLLFKGPLGD